MNLNKFLIFKYSTSGVLDDFNWSNCLFGPPWWPAFIDILPAVPPSSPIEFFFISMGMWFNGTFISKKNIGLKNKSSEVKLLIDEHIDFL